MTQNESSLRKAAILIDSLDERSAATLLEQMPPEQTARVRTAIAQLGAVDPVERQRVIHDFMQVDHATPDSPEEGGVEMDQSLVEKINSSATEPECELEEDEDLEEEVAPPAFASLHDAPADALASCLSREDPQTVALVLAHLPSRHSAQVLDLLPGHQRADVIRRLACLEETDDSILDELECQLLLELDRFEATRKLRERGQAVLAEIMDDSRGRSRQAVLASLEDDPAPSIEFYARSTPSEAPAPTSTPRTPKRTIAFQDLMNLDDANLARLLRASNPEIALLALTGASRSFVDRLLSRMSPRQARALKQRMAELGPIRLSDVERAQRQLADLAGQMADDGLIEIPSSRRFTIAA